MGEVSKDRGALQVSTQKWWRWPESKRRGTVPWWVVLRRLIAWPLLLLAAAFGWIGILIFDLSIKAANDWVRDAL